jgi:excisionase family DNA binding protein
MNTKKILIQPAATGEVFDNSGAAAYLKTKERTLRLWRSRAGLPFCRISGKTVLYRKSDIDSWLASRRVAITA